MRKFAADDPAVAHLPVVPQALSSLAASGFLLVVGPEGHHWQRVRRLRAGKRVTVADGHGSWCAAAVDRVRAGELEVRAVPPAYEEPVRNQAWRSRSRSPRAIRARWWRRSWSSVSTGSCPWWGNARSGGAGPQGRLERAARAAAVQCRRARLPVVEAPAPLLAVAGHPGLVVAERTGAPVATLASPEGGEWLVLVGPEGGLSAVKRAALTSAPRLGLGSHVLRAVTAPIAAAAALAGRRAVAEAGASEGSAGSASPAVADPPLSAPDARHFSRGPREKVDRS